MPVKRTRAASAPSALYPPPPKRGKAHRERPIIRHIDHAPMPGLDAEPEPLILRMPPPGQGKDPVFFVKDMRGLVRIDPFDIQYLQADGNYVELHLPLRRIVLRNSLAEVLKMLPADLMCQVNRSQAVNIRHLDLIGTDEVHIGELAFTLSKHFRDPLLGSVRVITGR